MTKKETPKSLLKSGLKELGSKEGSWDIRVQLLWLAKHGLTNSTILENRRLIHRDGRLSEFAPSSVKELREYEVLLGKRC
ncbi:MAG: hypothetical protein QXN08_01165 [Nitrososphaerales archaeon]